MKHHLQPVTVTNTLKWCGSKHNYRNFGCCGVEDIYTQMLGNAWPKITYLPCFGSASPVLKHEYINTSPPQKSVCTWDYTGVYGDYTGVYVCAGPALRKCLRWSGKKQWNASPLTFVLMVNKVPISLIYPFNIKDYFSKLYGHIHMPWNDMHVLCVGKKTFSELESHHLHMYTFSICDTPCDIQYLRHTSAESCQQHGKHSECRLQPQKDLSLLEDYPAAFRHPEAL